MSQQILFSALLEQCLNITKEIFVPDNKGHAVIQRNQREKNYHARGSENRGLTQENLDTLHLIQNKCCSVIYEYKIEKAPCLQHRETDFYEESRRHVIFINLTILHKLDSLYCSAVWHSWGVPNKPMLIILATIINSHQLKLK